MDSGWTRGTASGQLLAPVSRPLHLESLGWSPSTPAGGVKGEVILVEDVSADAVKALAPKVKGKIVILEMGKIFANGWVKVLEPLEASYKVFKDNGAVGLIFPGGDRNNVLSASDPNWGSSLLLMPGAQIGMEDFQLIRRSLEHGPVTMQFELQNTTSGPMQVNNVVAEIRGREVPTNGSSSARTWIRGTTAPARRITAPAPCGARSSASDRCHGQGAAPQYPLRALGRGRAGTAGFVCLRASPPERDGKCVAVLNTDNGAGHPKGWKVEGRKDVKDAMQPISDALLKDISGGALSIEVTYDTDHGPFMLQGVPALDLWVDMSHYGEVHHKSSDTYDKVDPIDLKAGAAIVAVTAWAIAEDPKPIASHLDHTAVAEILKTANLDKLLTYVGQWKP